MTDSNCTITILSDRTYKCIYNVEEKEACKCIINVEDDAFTISSWFTKEDYRHNGIGKITMRDLLTYLINCFGVPEKVNYIWNGQNQYVYDFITSNFDAVCSCPIAIQKTQFDDDWSSHIYGLNRDKVFGYFDIKIS